MKDIMLDLELMGAESPAGAICSIGAVAFALDGPDPSYEKALENSFHQAVSVKSCENIGMPPDGPTIAWWLGQGELPRAAILHKPIGIEEALRNFRRWLRQYSENGDMKDVRMWAKPVAGDFPPIEHAYRRIGSQQPWLGKRRYCLSTLKRTINTDWPSETNAQVLELSPSHKHIAVFDSWVQSLDARKVISVMGNNLDP